MSVSSFTTLLSLDEWAKIFGIAPEFFNGFDRTGRLIGSQCSSVWFQNPWADSGDRLSREEVAEAIYDAERMLMTELGYAPAPYWTENEWQDYPRPGIKPFYGLSGGNAYAQAKSVRLKLGRLIAGGVRATTAIQASAAITYSASDGNTSGYQDKATITVTTTVTDPCEIQVFFKTADGAPSAAHPRYQIRPLQISISGGTATIVGDRALFISPEIHEFQNASFTAANAGAGDTNFVQTVDVYRVYNDTNGDQQQQGIFSWETEPQGCANPPCNVSTQTLCLGLRDRDLGWVNPYPATWDSTDLVYAATDFAECREPDRLRVNYYSGIPREVGSDYCRMNRRYALMVARLAVALLNKTSCGCEQAERNISWWNSFSDLENEDISPQELENPFGRKRGAVFAWREAQALKNGMGLLLA